MMSNTKIDSRTREVRQTSAGWMFKQLGSSLDAEMNAELRLFDINLNQFAVIMTLLEAEGLTQAEIGKRIRMPGYSTTRTMDMLEERQLLERRPDERSRRSHRIYLTEKGRALAPDLFELVRKVNERLLSPLSEQERGQFLDALGKLVSARLS